MSTRRERKLALAAASEAMADAARVSVEKLEVKASERPPCAYPFNRQPCERKAQVVVRQREKRVAVCAEHQVALKLVLEIRAEREGRIDAL
jgi:hypothetical protein